MDINENREIAIISFQYSVVIKGIERKLSEMEYRVTIIKEDLKQEVDRLAGRVSLMLFYLPPDCNENNAVIKELRNMTQTVSDKEQKMILIGETKYKDSLIGQLPELKAFPWLDRPVELDVLEQVVTKITSGAGRAEKKHRILIVDDDPAYAKIVREWTKKEYKVDIVTDGMQAITFVLKLPENEKVDLILLDYEMPVVDGSQVLQMLKREKATANIPVIFLTGNSSREAVSRVMELKPDGYILKTTNKAELLELIRSKLKK